MSYDREKYVKAYVLALGSIVSITEADEFISQLKSVVKIFEEQNLLITALASRRLPANFERNLLKKLTQDCNEKVGRFLQIIVRNGHINIIKNVLTEFCDFQDQRQNKMVFIARVPYLPPQDQQDKIVEVLKNKFNLDKIQINYQIDRSLIGGIILKSKRYLIDDSLRTRLSRVRDSLLQMKISKKELEA